MDPAPQEVCDSWWMASYSFSQQEQPAWLFLGLQLGLLMSDMKWCLCRQAGRPWAIVKLILCNSVKSEEVVSEKKCSVLFCGLSRDDTCSIAISEDRKGIKIQSECNSNCFHVLGKMQVFSAWCVCASISVMMATSPFLWMLLLTRNPSKPILLSLGLYKMCRGSKEKQRAQMHRLVFDSQMSHGHTGLKLPI